MKKEHTYIHTLLNNKKNSIFDSNLIGADYIDSVPIFNAFNLLDEVYEEENFIFINIMLIIFNIKLYLFII